MNSLSNAELFQSQLERLSIVANEISECIADEEWEKLTMVLELRQQYLDQLFSDPIPEEYRDTAKEIAHAILEQDAISMAKVQEQMRIAKKLQVSYERGKKAIRAYNE
ncbi:MAG: flagellar protein FliT [Methylobacter sp.]|jgi:hypothetical protein